MSLFDFFRKKPQSGEAKAPVSDAPAPAAAPAPKAAPAPAPRQNEAMLDDFTFIRELKHIPAGPWHQYDILLAARPYGWDMMLDWADYMAGADLMNISQVTSAPLAGGPETNLTDSYQAHSGSCRETPELQEESGVLSVAGISRTLHAPMKIVWFNQTRVLRFFTLLDDESLINKYAETAIRRSFGTADAMKAAKPIPEEQ